MTRMQLIVEKNKRRKEIRDNINRFVFWSLVVIATIIPLSMTIYANSKETYIKQEYVSYCEKYGEKNCISPEVLEALIETESGGKADAVSSAGAVGLCQIIPRYSKYTRNELLCAELNIKACSEILFELCEKYEDMGLALVAYNCGEYSKTFKKCLANGNYTSYAEKILDRAYELEEVHGKHSY